MSATRSPNRFRMSAKRGSPRRPTPSIDGIHFNLKSDHPLVAPNYAARRSELARSLGLGRKAGTKAPARKQTSSRRGGCKERRRVVERDAPALCQMGAEVFGFAFQATPRVAQILIFVTGAEARNADHWNNQADAPIGANLADPASLRKVRSSSKSGRDRKLRGRPVGARSGSSVLGAASAISA